MSREWSEHEIHFDPINREDPYEVSYALGRAAYNELCTEWVHAEGPIYDERGVLVGHAAPSIVFDGLRDAWVDSRL